MKLSIIALNQLGFWLVAGVLMCVSTAPINEKLVQGEPIASWLSERRRANEKEVVAPKYMMDMFRVLVDERGVRRRGVTLNGDKVRCFFSGNFLFDRTLFNFYSVAKHAIVFLVARSINNQTLQPLDLRLND